MDDIDIEEYKDAVRGIRAEIEAQDKDRESFWPTVLACDGINVVTEIDGEKCGIVFYGTRVYNDEKVITAYDIAHSNSHLRLCKLGGLCNVFAAPRSEVVDPVTDRVAHWRADVLVGYLKDRRAPIVWALENKQFVPIICRSTAWDVGPVGNGYEWVLFGNLDHRWRYLMSQMNQTIGESEVRQILL